MACEVIEHVAHGDEFLRHIKRFVKPKGTLLLTTPNGNYCRSKLQTFSQIENFVELEKEQFKPDSDGHLYLYTPKEIRDLLRGLDFKNINIELSMTPWLSGHAGFRLLPRFRGLLLPYYLLDRMTTLISHAVGDIFCTQMIISANVNEYGDRTTTAA